MTSPQRVSQTAERVRRPSDLLSALLSLAALVIVIGSIHALPLGSTEVSGDVSDFLENIPRWLSSVAAVAAGISCFLLVVTILFIQVRNQWRDARNAITASVVAGAAVITAWSIWSAENGAVAHAVLHGKNPTMLVVDTGYVAFVVGCDLVRRSRWARWCTGTVIALLLTGLAINTLTPYAVAIVGFGGLLAGWLVRWVLGAASVRPTLSALIAWLEQHGIMVSALVAEGSSEQGDLQGVCADGTHVDVHLADRDTYGSGLARRLWSVARLRPVATGRIPLGSRAQLYQMALACSLAQKAGVPSPAVLLLEEMPNETLVLVTVRPPGTHPGDEISAENAAALFASLRALHNAGIAQRDLRPGNLVITGDSAGFSSLAAAVPGASVLSRRLDLAQLLVTVARSTDADAAIAGLRAGYRPADEAAVAAVMQPVALAPWGWSAMRGAQGTLTKVRHGLLGPGTAVPVARLERFRWRTVLSAFALTIAVILLIGEVSQHGNLLSILATANLGWFAVAAAASALTYFAASQNLAAFVPRRLSVVRGFLVQVATAFVGIAMPPTVGHVAVNARYLHREGVDENAIAAAVTLSQLVNVAMTVLLFVALALLTGSGLSRFHLVPGTDVLIGLAVIAVAAGVALAIPQTRTKVTSTVWPHLRGVWPRLLDALSDPARLLLCAGANLLLTFSYLLAFFASMYAVGVFPAILPAAVVYLAGNTVGSAAPTPGGIGAVEGVLTLGLVGIGVPYTEALSAVLLFRVATFWLPIPAGWLAYLGLQRSGTL